MDRHTGKLRESRLHGSLTLFCGVFLLDFLWSIILFSLVLRPYVVYLKVLPCAHVHLSARMDSSKEAKGTLTSPIMGVTLSLFDSQGVFLCRCHWDNLLDLENWDICDLYLLSGQGPAPLCTCHYHGLKVSPGGNVQLFTLFLLLFISGSVNRRLVVNV